jgi:hypothetical protein
MAGLPDGAADLLVTSPPFLALRSYLPADHPDKAREIGSEPTPAAFIDTMLGLTADWGRLVPEWGSICVELGDTMSGSGGRGGDYAPGGWREGQPGMAGAANLRRIGATERQQQQIDTFVDKDDGDKYRGARLQDRKRASHNGNKNRDNAPGWPLDKSMCMIPAAYSFALAYGHNPVTGQPSPAGQWRVRNVVTWARPNPPVGSLGKRNPAKRTGDYKFRPACSYITVACRGTGRYFDLDAVRTEHRTDPAAYRGNGYSKGHPEGIPGNEAMPGNPAGAPPLDWHTDHLDGDWLWKLATAPYAGSHYATFPLTLPRRLVLAMAPQRVCTICGWPSERISTADPEAQAHNVTRRVGRATLDLDRPPNTARGDLGAALFKPVAYSTLGWTDCGHDAWRPGMVLDPFGGSGTTAVAAALEGRDATLIDLDHRNVDLVRRRILDHLRIVSEHRDGDTITWTVETAAPNQRAQVNGQTSMLDLFNA